MKYYVVTMNDGSRYGIPAEIIADDYAKWYSKRDDNTTYQEEFDAMMEWFDAKDFEFADWAKNNMNWEDVKDEAVLLESKPIYIDFQECWVNGEYEYLEVEERI